MSRKINPIGIRLPLYKTWPSLWHTDYNYPILFLEDTFIKGYLKTELKHYKLEVLECIIKRSYNRIFISVFMFNTNQRANHQFKSFLFLRSFRIFHVALQQEIKRFIFSIYKLSGVLFVHLSFKTIRYQKPNLKAIALTANPILLGSYFARRYIKMNSYKYIFKSFKKIYNVLYNYKFNLKGLKVKVSGPVKAPRVRRSQINKKLFFGTVPVQAYSNVISYHVRTRSLGEGVVTAKFWLFKRLRYPNLLKPNKLIETLTLGLATYKKYKNFSRFRDSWKAKYWRIYNLRFNRISTKETRAAFAQIRRKYPKPVKPKPRFKK